MMGNRQTLQLFAVAEDGEKTPLPATGLRVPLEQDRWVALDFEGNDKVPLTVKIAARGRRSDLLGLPKLTLEPHAGNSVSIVFNDNTAYPRSELQVLAVSESDLGGNQRDWLSQTTSGDPVGEILLDRGDGKPVTARQFRIEHGTHDVVTVILARQKNAQVAVHVAAQTDLVPMPGHEFRCLALGIFPHGCNLISVCFKETAGFVAG